MIVNISSINGVPPWHWVADPRGLSPFCGYADPITCVEKYNSEWHFTEVYVERSTGSYGRFLAVNGQTIGDRHSPNYGISKEEIYDMYYVNLYGVIFPVTGSIDDIEISDAPPCATLPCGASGTGSRFKGTIPPVITSPLPIMAPTFTLIALYQLGFLLTTRRGLISGTPTKAGTFTPWLEVTNNAGKGVQPLEIEINSN